jgi:hypothetical protein
MSSQGPFASLNHHLSDFDQFVFSDAQDEEFGHPETSLHRLNQSIF